MSSKDNITIIDGRKPSLVEYFKKVYEYKSLILILAKRDLKVQYAQTTLGVLWSVIQPLTGLLIFTIFFTRLIIVDTGMPYHIFAFSGIVCWFYFTFLVGHVGESMSASQDLIKKVYFPKFVLLFSKVLVGLVEFFISFALLIIMLLIGGIIPSGRIVLFPLALLLLIITGLSLGIWLAALTIRFRDFHHLIPYIVNFGIWLCPVFYPATIIPPDYQYINYINAMTAIIEGFRWIMIPGLPVPSHYYLFSFIPVIILFVTGILHFRRVEDQIPDFI